ncbi:MAG TPA: cytochrome C oxidase subunit IV family protein [Bacteroidota bacterium]|nr:cytochrome C oxidase subunit IV family protein [Bacteroidota bacterium]
MEKHEAHAQHIVSYGQYLLIWLGLVALTCLTVALAGIDLGRWVIVTALVIASVKGLFVLNNFMHLKFEERVFRIFVLVALVTFLIFISLTFFDYAFH